MTQNFGDEVCRKLLKGGGLVSRDELREIIRLAVREEIRTIFREELQNFLLPIREDVIALTKITETLTKRSQDRDVHCAAETAKSEGIIERVTNLEESVAQGDGCRGCVNRDRILIAEQTLAQLVKSQDKQQKFIWGIISGLAVLAIKEIILHFMARGG